MAAPDPSVPEDPVLIGHLGREILGYLAELGSDLVLAGEDVVAGLQICLAVKFLAEAHAVFDQVVHLAQRVGRLDVGGLGDPVQFFELFGGHCRVL